MPTALLVYVRT